MAAQTIMAQAALTRGVLTVKRASVARSFVATQKPMVRR